MKNISKIIGGISIGTTLVVLPIIATQVISNNRNNLNQNTKQKFKSFYSEYLPGNYPGDFPLNYPSDYPDILKEYNWFYDFIVDTSNKPVHYSKESKVIDENNFSFFVPSEKNNQNLLFEAHVEKNNNKISHINIVVYSSVLKNENVSNDWFNKVIKEKIKSISGINIDYYIDFEKELKNSNN